jgi:hypothetical protein
VDLGGGLQEQRLHRRVELAPDDEARLRREHRDVPRRAVAREVSDPHRQDALLEHRVEHHEGVCPGDVHEADRGIREQAVHERRLPPGDERHAVEASGLELRGGAVGRERDGLRRHAGEPQHPGGDRPRAAPLGPERDSRPAEHLRVVVAAAEQPQRLDGDRTERGELGARVGGRHPRLQDRDGHARAAVPQQGEVLAVADRRAEPHLEALARQDPAIALPVRGVRSAGRPGRHHDRARGERLEDPDRRDDESRAEEREEHVTELAATRCHVVVFSF